MSLRINHNLAALNAHRNLVNTTNMLHSSMQKLSSGYRINRGADDPAGLVISEQFRAQIAGLNKAIGNSEGSISMIQTAEGALTEVNALLVSMRELAIHAANEGFNDADQLAADQAEIENAIATVDRIAVNTQFGTKRLIDGSNENVATITSPNTTSEITIKSSNLRTGTYSISSVKTADASAVLNSDALGISLNNTDGDPYNLSDGIHNVDVVQSSGVARKVGDKFHIKDAWDNGLAINAAAAAAKISMSSAAFSAADTPGLPAEETKAIHAGEYSFIVNYQEFGGTPVGNQTISINVASGDGGTKIGNAIQAALDANSVLSGKVNLSQSLVAANTTFSFKAANEGAQYSLFVQSSSTDATTARFAFSQGDSRGISNGVVNLTSVTDGAGNSANITLGNAIYTDVSTLVTDLNTQILAGAWAANEMQFVTNVNGGLDLITYDEGSDYSVRHQQLQATFAGKDMMHVLGLSHDTVSVTGVDARVSFDGYENSVSSIKYASTGTFTLNTAAYGDPDQGTLEIIVDKAAAASGSYGVQTGNLLLTVTGTKFDVRLDGGPTTAVTAGIDGTVFNTDRTQSLTFNIGLTATGGNETISNTDQSLVFQIGGNVGQTAYISLPNLSGSSLGQNLVGNMFSSLANINVTTAEGAQHAQSVIDAAINEVSTTRGNLGSFQKNTLEANLRNLRIASQNLTAAESQIRDTDMAQEMSEFTRNQILVQAGVAMLAQANQIPQVVLSLFG